MAGSAFTLLPGRRSRCAPRPGSSASPATLARHGQHRDVRRPLRVALVQALARPPLVQHGAPSLSLSCTRAGLQADDEHTRTQAFEFLFSQPFRKGTPTWEATSKELQQHTLGPIHPEKPIFRDGKTGATLSYGRLYRDALTVASSLTDGHLTLQPAPASSSNPLVNRGAIVSPTILLHLPNCLPFVTLAYGVLASGLTLTAANPVLTPPELAHILTLSEPAALVTTTAGVATFQAAFKLLAPELQAKLSYATRGNVFLVNLDGDDYGASAAALAPLERSLGGWTVHDWKILLPAKPKPFTPPRYTGSEDALRAAMIFWSSGTSGKSKGVILTHRAIGSALIGVWHASTLGEDERLVGLPPFYHIVRPALASSPSPLSTTSLTLSPTLAVRMGQRPHGGRRTRRDRDDHAQVRPGVVLDDGAGVPRDAPPLLAADRRPPRQEPSRCVSSPPAAADDGLER